MLEKTLESPLDSKKIQPVHSKGNQSWIFIGKTDAEAEAPILWPSDVKSQLPRKDPDAGKHWSQKEKEGDSMRWLYSITDSRDLKLNNIWEDGEGKGSPGCCSPWGRKGRTRLSNWTTTMDYKSVICVPILRNKKNFLKKQKTVIQLRTFTSSTLMPEGSWRNVQRKQLLKTSQIIPPSEVLQGVCEREGKCVSDFCCWELTGDLMASRS